MARFKVLCAGYRGSDGVHFKRGEVVDTVLDLVATFGEKKFARVVDAPAVPAAPPLPRIPELPPAVAKAVKAAAPAVQIGSAPAIPTQAPASPPPAPKAVKSKLGSEVTARFPTADKAGMVIFRQGTGYFVAAAVTPDKPLNDKALNRGDVAQFITDHTDNK